MSRSHARATSCTKEGCGNLTRHATRRCRFHREHSGIPGVRDLPSPSPSSGVVPRVLGRYDGGRTEEWPEGIGCPNRPGGPTSVTYRADGTVKYESFLRGDDLHRLDGPAAIDYFRSGRAQRLGFYVDGELHRTDGPAEVIYQDLESMKASELFYVRGVKHRIGGPAEITYGPKNRVEREVHYRHGKLHRIDGPADSRYDHRGGVMKRTRTSWCFIDPDRGPMYAADARSFAALIGRYPEEWLRDEFAKSDLAPYLADGAPLSRFLEVVESELRSPEAIRAVFEGAPVEWARAFESSSSTT